MIKILLEIFIYYEWVFKINILNVILFCNNVKKLYMVYILFVKYKLVWSYCSDREINMNRNVYSNNYIY